METQTKTTLALFFLAIASAIIHNFIFWAFFVEEPIFFVISLLLVVGFLGSIIYNIYTYATSRKPKDLWKLGWLGLFGLLGILPGVSIGLFGFYGFFGFFGLKK